MSKKTKEMRAEKKKKATYNMTAEMLDALEDKVREEAVGQSVIAVAALSVMVINDKFGTLADAEPDKRAEVFTDHLFNLWDEFNEGRITFKDCIDVLKDECGIDIKEKGGKK